MKILMVALLGIAVLPSIPEAAETASLTSAREKISYGIGVEVARGFTKNEMDIDRDLLFKGLKDGLDGKKLLIPEKELRRAINSYQSEVRQKAARNRRTAAEANRKKGEAF